MSTKIEIKDNEFLRQFEFYHQDEMARVEYSLQERKIFLTKFEMPQSMIDLGLKDPFLETIFDEIKERNISLVPTCAEVTSFFRKNRKKYKDILPIGIAL